MEGKAKMKKLMIALVLILAGGAFGCRSTQHNVFHVKAVNPDAPIDVIGTLEGKEYSLSVNRDKVPLYVAYYEPIRTEDVGKEFHAEAKDGSLFIDVPDKGTVRYDIRAVSEAK